ncbi:hypothetical protein HZ994_18465 [Akkermansiaceae bacterium]|nr:hypothetical protein HZ994_18465 [Akkermansiaceae bacterium]
MKTLRFNGLSASRLSGRKQLLAGFLTILAGVGSLAAQMTAIPQLSSRPGAAYTIYLNVGGFDYNGLWNGHATSPGFTPAVNRDATNSTGSFDAAEQAQIKKIWARLAQSYTGFDVNVTTVDPAVAAGQAANDAQRQAYYDATPNMLHTVVGSQIRTSAPAQGSLTPQSKWYDDGADGVSGLGIAAGNDPTASGAHTNWMFSEAQAGSATGGIINGDYIGAVSAHENGHAFGLIHQGDFTTGSSVNTSAVNEYGLGDTVSGNGSYVAIMGQASGNQRVVWRDGTVFPNGSQEQQNDVKTMLSTNTAAAANTAGRMGGVDLKFIDDGVGKSIATASVLAVNSDGTVNYVMSSGIIVPKSESDPQAIGSSNYTSDYFSFATDGTQAITLTLNNSTQYLEAGVADGVGTFRGILEIFNADGTQSLGNGTEAPDTLTNTFSSGGNFAAGNYLAKISSRGGHAEDTNGVYKPANYFEMGGFFLTGSGFMPIPEPSAAIMVLFSAAFFLRRRR